MRDLDSVCSRIANGETYTAIAQQEGITNGALSMWLEATPERSARARAARILAARGWDELATAGIDNARDPFELAKAKELAHHYRWRASKIAPEYSDKVSLEHKGRIVAARELSDDELTNIAAASSAGTAGQTQG